MSTELIQMNQQGSSENIHSCILYSQVALQTGMFGISVSRCGGLDEGYEFFQRLHVWLEEYLSQDLLYQ